MKRIIRLTESDLTRLVRRVIKEREMDDDRPLNSKKFMFDDIALLIKEASSQVVQNYLSQLPDTIRFISIVNCESADFSEVDICGFDDLAVVNLMNTPNNFEENVDCDFEKIGDFMYDFESDDDEDFDFEDDDDMFETLYEDVYGSVHSVNYEKEFLNEAEYQGRKVQLGKVMQGDVKKSKVYVKNDKGKVVKVNFGFGGTSAKGKRMTIKKSDPARRKAFRARHNCENPGPRWKPRYWSCRAW